MCLPLSAAALTVPTLPNAACYGLTLLRMNVASLQSHTSVDSGPPAALGLGGDESEKEIRQRKRELEISRKTDSKYRNVWTLRKTKSVLK